jgi:hypothetical protein
MEKTIKVVGLIMIIISSIIIFFNTMGSLVWSFIGSENIENSEVSFEEIFIVICLTMILFGIFFLIGGIFIRKLKLWANYMVSIVSSIFTILLWFVSISFYIKAIDPGFIFFKVILIVTSFFFSAPLLLLVWFLNKSNVKSQFN